MDIATIAGMFVVWGLIVFSILLGSSLLIFVDVPSAPRTFRGAAAR